MFPSLFTMSFFFSSRRRHTRLQGDWSSDVCSSDLTLEPSGALALRDRRSGERFFDLLRLEDGGDAGDTYTYCPPARDRVVRAGGPIKVRRLAAGPLVAALEAPPGPPGGRGGGGVVVGRLAPQ